jgi:hypothetical protein
MLRLEVEFKYYLKAENIRPAQLLNYCFIYIAVLTYLGTYVLLKLETPSTDYIILFSRM